MVSLRARIVKWTLWRSGRKAGWMTGDGLRERIMATRGERGDPPASLRERFRVEEVAEPGGRSFVVAPKSGPVGLRVLYLHGGAYVKEIVEPQWGMVGAMVERLGAAVTVALYPLAPEVTCLDVLAFVEGVYVRMMAEGGPFAVVGDSAGAGLALALAQHLRDSGKQQVTRLVLISPWLDVTCGDVRQVGLERVDPMLGLAGLQEAGRWYAGELATTDARVSPLFGDVSGLPPMLVLTGTHDLLHPDALRLAEKGGSGIRLRTYRGMPHVWPAMPMPEGKKALGEVVEFLG